MCAYLLDLSQTLFNSRCKSIRSPVPVLLLCTTEMSQGSNVQQELLLWHRHAAPTRRSCVGKKQRVKNKKKKRKNCVRGRLTEVPRFTVNNGAQINSCPTLLLINATSTLNLIYKYSSCSNVKKKGKKGNTLFHFFLKLCEDYLWTHSQEEYCFLICTTMLCS